MSGIVIPLVLRVLALFGVKLSPFAGGAIVTAIAAVAIGAACLKIYNAGYDAAETKCETAALASELEAVKRDRDAARSAERDANGRTALIRKASEEEKGETERYVERLREEARTAGAACDITDDDLRGLRIERGKAPGGRARAPAGGVKPDAAGRRSPGS